jgi:hypothetical protein
MPILCSLANGWFPHRANPLLKPEKSYSPQDTYPMKKCMSRKNNKLIKFNR